MISPKIAGGVGLAAALAWLFAERSAGAAAARGGSGGGGSLPRDATGPQVPMVHAPDQFPRGHGQAFARYVVQLLGRHGLTGEPAVLFTAHVCREVANGAAVFNYNFGNVKAHYWAGPWYRNSDGQPYRAYASDDEGIEDDLAFMRDRNGGRYRRAWELLMAGDRAWYSALGLAGYYECCPPGARDARGHCTHYVACTPDLIAVPQADYEAFLRRIRGWLA